MVWFYNKRGTAEQWIKEVKLADFVLLAADPPPTDPYAIKNIQVVATYMGRKATFDA